MLDSKYIIEMCGITKEFLGVTALNNVNLNIMPGTVYALVGENGAGKSTLMKIICGMYSLEHGRYMFKGKPVTGLTPLKGIEMGISMIHQELSPILEMTIAENIFLGREPLTKTGLINYKKMRNDAEELLKSIDLNLDVNSKMNILTIAEIQMVEIVKAISRDASLIIMDEPTSSISGKEIEELFSQIRRLKEKNVSIIYITHRLLEVFEIADEIMIMRDGYKVSQGAKSEYTMERVIKEMVGRALTNVYPKMEYNIRRKAFEVKALSGGHFKDVSFHVNAGEIVGFSGLVGAGRTELVRAIFGLDPISGGEIELYGEPLKIRHPVDAISKGIIMTSEDRKMLGLILARSIRENIALPNLAALEKNGLLNRKKENALIDQMVKSINIKLHSPEQSVSNLSGGNQQKVVLAKWLSRDVKVLMLDEPTRGIDVGAKYEIYTMIGEIASRGIAVIVISSEIPELLGVCNRIYVMRQGSITGNFQKATVTQEDIMACSVIGYNR